METELKHGIILLTQYINQMVKHKRKCCLALSTAVVKCIAALGVMMLGAKR